MHTVKFVTKIVEAGDPDDRLLTDRSEDFLNFTTAMAFIRSLRSRLSKREVLVGNPELIVA